MIEKLMVYVNKKNQMIQRFIQNMILFFFGDVQLSCVAFSWLTFVLREIPDCNF